MTGFFDLPPEVRLTIYQLLLPKQDLELQGWSQSGPTFHDVSDLEKVAANWAVGPILLSCSSIFRANRKTFEEVYPLLYSQHSFILRASTATVKFLRQIGQLNRDALREIHIEYRILLSYDPEPRWQNYDALKFVGADPVKPSSWIRKHPKRGAKFFNVLTKCSNASITIKTTLRTLAFLDGSSEYPAFGNMHGFAKATCTASRGWNWDYDYLPQGGHGGDQQAPAKAAIEQRLSNGVKRLESPCPKGCGVHGHCTSKTMTATVHLEVQCNECWACTHDDFLHIWIEKKGSIFGLPE